MIGPTHKACLWFAVVSALWYRCDATADGEIKFSRAEVEGYAPGYASGLFATQLIKEGETLLVVHPNETLSADTPVRLMAKLFCHHALGERSPLHESINGSMGQPGSSLYEELVTSPALKGAPHLRQATLGWHWLADQGQHGDRCSWLFAEEDNASQLLGAWAQVSAERRQDFRLWLWADHQVRSRSFGDVDSGTDGATAAPVLILSPASLFNHGGSRANVIFTRRKERGTTFTFTSSVEIIAGTELLITYGERPSALAWLQSYEFVPSELWDAPACRSKHPHLAQQEAGSSPPLVTADECFPGVEPLLAACAPDYDLRCMHAYAMGRDDSAYYNLCFYFSGVESAEQ